MGGRNRGGSYKNNNKRGRTQRRDFRDGRENVWKKSRSEEQSAQGWAAFVKESPAFESYYKKQRVVGEEEWDEFISTLGKPLPTTFRINGSGQFAWAIRDQMQHEFFDYLKDFNELDGESVEPARALPWYRDKLAWNLNFSRTQIRKSPILSRIHEFLKKENEVGSITRQEAVSMLPPLFLDVQPHHRVLDMCAAPGSKTFQLLEMIHKNGEPGVPSDGLVIANDLDVQRCHLLIHQTKRMCSPNILVTNHEAQHFPGLKHQKVPAMPEKQEDLNNDNEKGLWFDRVLCDVPCSGDGTIRKAPDIWKKWNSGIGNGLHRLQVQIAMRGVSLLRVGGRLVYSTCSLNPLENEAVVSEILRRSHESMELLDVSFELPELKRRPGLLTWKVRDKGKWYSSYSQIDRHRAGMVVPGMFPSGKGWSDTESVESEKAKNGRDWGRALSADTLEFGESANVTVEEDDESEIGEVSDLPLDRCVRILPHDQDTGGFFIAVFQKIQPFKFRPTKAEGGIHHSSRSSYNIGKHVTQESESHAADCCRSQKMDDHDVLDNRHDKKDKMADPHGESSLISVPSVDQPNFLEPGVVAEGLKVSIDSLGDLKVPEEYSHCAPHGLVLQSPLVTNSDALGCGQVSDSILENDIVERDNKVPTTNEVSTHRENGRIQKQGPWRGVDPVLFLNDDSLISSLVSFYGIMELLPLKGHLVTRSDDILHFKRIYYVAQPVSDVIQLNLQTGEQLKISSAGLKIFERHTAKEGSSACSFRIASEGLPVLLPYITKQRLKCSRADFRLLLSSKVVPLGGFHDPAFGSALQNLLPGCCVIDLASDTLTESVDCAVEQKSPAAIACWRGRTNLSLLVTKTEAEQMLERLCLTDVVHDLSDSINQVDHLGLPLTEEVEDDPPETIDESGFHELDDEPGN